MSKYTIKITFLDIALGNMNTKLTNNETGESIEEKWWCEDGCWILEDWWRTNGDTQLGLFITLDENDERTDAILTELANTPDGEMEIEA